MAWGKRDTSTLGGMRSLLVLPMKMTGHTKRRQGHTRKKVHKEAKHSKKGPAGAVQEEIFAILCVGVLCAA